LDVQPTGIDLTKQIIAEKEKVGHLIDAEARLYKKKVKAESNLY